MTASARGRTWPAWLAANAVAGAACGPLFAVLFFAAPLTFGLVFGPSQWAALRLMGLPVGAAWAVVTAAGVALGVVGGRYSALYLYGAGVGVGLPADPVAALVSVGPSAVVTA